MLFALLAVVGTILAIGFQDIASATPNDVTFNPVTIRNGVKIHVNGDKTLTAIDNGNKLFADNTNGTAVTDSQIASELTAYKTSQYGKDLVNKVTGDASLVSESLLYYGVPGTDSSYWLNDTKNSYGFSMRGFRRADNSFSAFRLTGMLPSGQLLLNKQVGGFDPVSNVYFNDVVLPVGTYLPFEGNNSYWFSASGLYSKPSPYSKTIGFLIRGLKVWNDPYCIEDESRSYRSTIIKEVGDAYMNNYTYGRIKFKNNIPTIEKLSVGDRVYRNDILVCVGYYSFKYDSTFFQEYFVLDDDTDFVGDSWNNNKYRVFFTKIDVDCFVGFKYNSITKHIPGLYLNDSSEFLEGTRAPASKHCIRPNFDFDSSQVAYVKPSTDNSTPTIASSFTETPTSVAYAGDDKKLVIKSDEVSISSGISNDKIASDRQDSGAEYRDNTIYVPYNSKLLTIKPDAFSTNNASHITALINQAGVKKYAVLSDMTSDLNIDLNNILNTKTPGSNIAISFYAEKINGDNTSDEISDTPVTITLEVAQGNEQTIKYDLDGGSGAVPQSATIRAGKQYQLADGSTFSKESNKFSAWQITYTPYGETEVKTRIVNSNETIVVPDAQGQTIAITALYGGIKASKTTETKLSYTVIWNTNAPDGYMASFDESESGDFNSDRSKKFDKVKIQNSTVAVPSKPKLNTDDYFFVGWYERTDQTNEVSGSVNVTQDKTYYGIWAPYTFYTDIDTGYDNPAKSSRDRYDMTWLQNKVDFLATGDKESFDWLNDYYMFKNSRVGKARIYSLLKDSDGSWMNPDNAESWVEFRLIHFGDHDGDGSMMTFQMTHSIRGTKVQFSDLGVSNKEKNWKDSLLRKNVNEGGSLYSRFDPKLTAVAFEVEKKYNYAETSSVLNIKDLFFPLSYTEFQANVNQELWTKDSFGSTYDFWKKQTIINDDINGESNGDVESLCKARRGDFLGVYNTDRRTWLRSTGTSSGNTELTTYKGYLASKNSSDDNLIDWSRVAYPCLAFAMGYKG